jgi:oligoendopeptidase F
MSDTKLPLRSSIDKRYLWNAESLFPDRAAWCEELKAVDALLPGLSAKAGSIGSAGGAALADLLDAMLSLNERMGKVLIYAYMSQAVDTLDAEAQGMNGQASGLASRFMAACAFLEPELIALGREKLGSWMDAEPRLAEFRHHFLDDLFRKQEHVRSAEVEELLGLASEVFQAADTVRDLLVDADMKFAPARGAGEREAEVAQGSVEKLLASPDRELRRSAWRSYCDGYIAHENSLSASLCAAMKRDVFNARSRRFPSSVEAALFENDVPRSVYDSTIAAFKAKLPVWHRYWRVRRKALGVERLEHCDIWAPISKAPPVIPFERGVDYICDALAPLGKDYVRTLRRGVLEERWVDVYPSVGKSSGAFSCGWKGTHPFVKMQYVNDLSSMSTLVHELGHSMHTYHANAHQNAVNADYPIFAAEVASNFNQAMLRAHLFGTEKDPQFQIAVIEEAMDNLHRYFFIMPTLARFELEMHERLERGGSVAASDMNELMADLFEEGYGGELEVDRHREGSTWAQFGHLYMNYYVFQYATGISAAHALAAPILAGDSAAAERYIGFLSSGASDYPVELLRKAGVDMRSGEAMDKCYDVLEGLIDRLERLTALA